MLASITPLGERGRRSRWGVTVVAFAFGATAAAVLLGAALGAVGAAVIPASVDARTRVVAAAVGLAVALVIDVGPWRVPGPRRQVNERWLDEFRGWVYGVGFGAQLGLGVTTVVTSAATYAALAAAWLAGPAGGAIVLGSYGAVRGLTPLAAVRVRSTTELMAMHRGLARWRAPVRYGSYALLGLICVTAAVA